ncbi:MAG: hypothetical protein ACLQPH_05005 [Acidimicrobiales bacterium]
MAEGLTSGDVAGEISKHRDHTSHAHGGDGDGSTTGAGSVREHDRTLSIVEAIMLAIVALLAAYTGYASAKWSTESSVRLASASAARTEANRAALDAQDTKNFDSTTFNTWFTAYVAGNTTAEAVAERRFRPAFKVAFDAWLATDPFTNAAAPPGPTYMPQYKQPELAQSAALDKKADQEYRLGVQAGANSDNYVRDTIYLATILFLVGISGHFRFFRIRLGLVGLGGVMLLVAIVEILTSPPVP